MKYFLGIFGHDYTEEEKQANEYYPVQSPSELAAGHPIVGVS